MGKGERGSLKGYRCSPLRSPPINVTMPLLDHVIVMGDAHLRRLLRAYANYYNTWRTHLGLDKDTPFGRPIHDCGRIMPIPKLGGLHHAYVRI